MAIAIKQVMQHVDPWMSEEDIGAGALWASEVKGQLETARFGIICLTRANQSKPWILFEAGALAHKFENTYVCPYLIDLQMSEMVEGPLKAFQAKLADKQGTLELLKTINRIPGEKQLLEGILERAFEKYWPDLSKVLSSLPPRTPASPALRPPDKMLDEILLGIREIWRMLLQNAESDRLRRLYEDFLSKPVPALAKKYAESATGPQAPSLATLLASKEIGEGPSLAELLTTEPRVQGTSPQWGITGSGSSPQLDPAVSEKLKRWLLGDETSTRGTGQGKK